MNNSSATFMATIPDGMNAFQQGRDNVRVLLDIPRIYLTEAMKLMVMREGVLSVTVTYEGERHEVPMQTGDQSKSQAGKGEWGQFWKHLKLAGFENCPGVREDIEKNKIVPDSTSWEVLRLMFGVDSLTFISPDEVKGRFDNVKVHLMVDQALRKVTQ